MAEELKIEPTEEQDVAEESTPEYSEVELEAIEHGWNPEGVEGKRNLSAEEFLDRQPLYDDLRSQKKQIKRLNEGVEALKKHYETQLERDRTRIINELKAAKKAALESENYDAVIDIDDQIAETQAQAKKPATNEDFSDWVEDNEWYNTDSEMKEYADMVGAGYYQNHPNKSVSEVYNYVSDEVKKRFPEKFGGNPARQKPSPVEGAAKGRQGTSKQYSEKDLPEQDRQIMNTIVRSGAMTKQEYLKQYFGA